MRFLLLISLLVVVTIAMLSVFFYREFQRVIDQRVLLQLTSIKRLKGVQIEDYLNREWETFLEWEIAQDTALINGETLLITGRIDTIDFIRQLDLEGPYHGVYDLTPLGADGRIWLAFIKNTGDGFFVIKKHQPETIQQILLERTGMGNSGETYLVGADQRLRSASRFFPKRSPYAIAAETQGVERSLNGRDGSGIFEDYRGIPVYSSYYRLDFSHLTWVILSEIDVQEAKAPLVDMRRQLALISLLAIVLAIGLSYSLAGLFSRPILRMRNLLRSMSEGNYQTDIEPFSGPREINEMFTALTELRRSINGAIQFSMEVGNMNLDANFQPAGHNDKLGASLLRMRDQLIEFNRLKKQSSRAVTQSFLMGQEKERNRLAKELHDGLGPLLTSLKILVQSSTSLPSTEKEQMKKLIDQTITDVRRITYDLMPQALLDFGVGKALSNLTDLVGKTSDLNIRYINSMRDDSNLESTVHINLFRITQELLNNTLKHAKAKNVGISLTEFDHKISLFYQDDGRGFDLDEVRQGFGLNNIKERVNVFDGYLSINSGPTGTEVEVEIPINS